VYGKKPRLKRGRASKSLSSKVRIKKGKKAKNSKREGLHKKNINGVEEERVPEQG